MGEYKVRLCTKIGEKYSETVKIMNEEELEEIKQLVCDIESVGYFARYEVIEEAMRW